MPLSKQEDFFVPEFSEEQVSIATTEFSTHAPSEANRSYATGMDDTASVSGAGSVRGDSQPNLNSVSDIRHTPDKRVKEDFGDDQAFFESESEDITTEEDEEHEPVFVKPTKPAPRKKINATVTSTVNETDSIKLSEINEV